MGIYADFAKLLGNNQCLIDTQEQIYQCWTYRNSKNRYGSDQYISLLSECVLLLQETVEEPIKHIKSTVL